MQITVDEEFKLQIRSYDDDGDKLTYSAEPAWIEIDPDTGIISFKPGSDRVGSHEVTVYVTDGTHTTEETFTLQIHSTVDYKLIAMIMIYIFLGLLIVLAFLFKRRKLIGTEKDICHRLKKETPDKTFHSLKSAVCPNMKKITLEKVLKSMESLGPKIELSETIMWKPWWRDSEYQR